MIDKIQKSYPFNPLAQIRKLLQALLSPFVELGFLIRTKKVTTSLLIATKSRAQTLDQVSCPSLKSPVLVYKSRIAGSFVEYRRGLNLSLQAKDEDETDSAGYNKPVWG